MTEKPTTTVHKSNTVSIGFPTPSYSLEPEPDEEVDVVARAICDVWGYLWDGDPDGDDQVAPEKEGIYDERPSKQMYRDAARAAMKALDEHRAAEAPTKGEDPQ